MATTDPEREERGTVTAETTPDIQAEESATAVPTAAPELMAGSLGE